jgi:N-methylhydantoinase A
MLEFSVDARYHSQPWDLTIPLQVNTFRDTTDVVRLVETFHEIHKRMRGSREEGQFVKFSNWRVKAIGKTKELEFFRAETGIESISENAIIEKRKAFFRELGGMVDTLVLNGDELKAGNEILPPAIIEEMATTIVVFPGSKVTVSGTGSYIVEIARK